MIAPIVLKVAIGVGVAGELATLAAAQTASVDNTAVWVAGIGFAGLTVTSVLTFLNQRAAANEARAAARELRESAALQVTKVAEIHDLVNSRSAAQAEVIAKQTTKIDALHAELLDRADAAPSKPAPDPNNDGTT